MLKNSKGRVWYGMHFYPGVAEYQEPGKEPYRVFLNEDTIRAMGPTFTGRPIYVEHVDGVPDTVDEVREGADGWVLESFYNSADGKHWVKFITVSEKAERAIEQGMRLSNAYIPTSFARGGVWNGVSYTKEITDGEYEHLAIVRNPRYQESVILSPEEFKTYNSDKETELKRLANSKGDNQMGLSFFKRSKVENSGEMESTIVKLPKSGKEMSITEIVTDLDARLMNSEANVDHTVKVGKESMTVKALLEKNEALSNEIEELKNASKEDPADMESMDNDDDMEDMDNEDSDEDREKEIEAKKNKAKKNKAKKKNSVESDEVDGDESDVDESALALAEKKVNALKAKREHFEKLKNAQSRSDNEEVATVELLEDQIARGAARY